MNKQVELLYSVSIFLLKKEASRGCVLTDVEGGLGEFFTS